MEEQKKLHEVINYSQELKSTWMLANEKMFGFIGEVFLHYKTIIDMTKWESLCIDDKKAELYRDRGAKRRLTKRLASTYKASIFETKLIQDIDGTKDKLVRQTTNKSSNTGRAKRMLETYNLADDDNFVSKLHWLVFVDTTKQKIR